jgi:hypothetical protein
VGFVFALVFVGLYLIAIGIFVGGIFILISGIVLVKVDPKAKFEDNQPINVNSQVDNSKKTSYVFEIILIIIGLPFVLVGIGIILIAGALISIIRKKRKSSPNYTPKKRVSSRKVGKVMCIVGCIMIIVPIALRIGIGVYSSEYQEDYVNTGVMCKEVESGYLDGPTHEGHFIISFEYKGEKYVPSQELSYFRGLKKLNVYNADDVFTIKEDDVVANIKYRDSLYFLIGSQEYLNVYEVKNDMDYNILFIYYDFRDIYRIYVPEKHKQEIEQYYNVLT